jgi:putative tryptophan/tyrosine transport system substrate-binding protein
MKRRDFITLLSGAAATWPLAARAQQSSGAPLIGILSPLSAGTATRNIEGFRAGLRELGYFEGRNVTLALRFAEGIPERMPALATELVGLKPDVIVAAPETSLLAVRNVTRTIPIITIWLQDPVASGAVESIARPGGHVTGTWIAGDDALVGKRLELIKEAVPTVARIGVLVSPAEVQDSVIMRLLSAPARALGLTVTVITVRDAAGIGAAFAAAARDNVEALFVSQSPFFNTHRVEIAAQAARARLPAIYGFREFADAGGLMSYGPSLPDVYRRFATLVDKILKGASPADLPVEVPTRFALIVNLKAAKAIDLTIRESFLLRADEVIE